MPASVDCDCPGMAMAFDFENVSVVPERYAHMQGLRLVPLGVPFLVSAAGRAGWLDWISRSAVVRADLWFLMFFAALACGALVGRYYTRRFGWISVRERGVPGLAIAAAVFVVLWWIHREVL